MLNFALGMREMLTDERGELLRRVAAGSSRERVDRRGAEQLRRRHDGDAGVRRLRRGNKAAPGERVEAVRAAVRPGALRAQSLKEE